MKSIGPTKRTATKRSHDRKAQALKIAMNLNTLVVVCERPRRKTMLVKRVGETIVSNIMNLCPQT